MVIQPWTIYIQDNNIDKVKVFGMADKVKIGLLGTYDKLNPKKKLVKNLIKSTVRGFNLWKKFKHLGLDYEELVTNRKYSNVSSEGNYPIINQEWK